MSEWDEGYLKGWNDRREFEKLILDATAYTLNNMTQPQAQLLLQIRADFTDDGARFEEEHSN